MRYLALEIFGTKIEGPPDIGKISEMKDPIEKIFKFGIESLMIIAVVLALIFLIFSAIQWITSGGSKEGIQKAKNRIIYSIIGLIIVLLSFAIVRILGDLFQVSLFERPQIQTKNTKPR